MTQKELESKIEAAQFTYYIGEPTISDSEFDTLWDTLKTLYPNSKVLKKVGSDLGESNGFKKEKHNIVMGSQNKANTVEEMDEFIKDYSYIGQYKMDGSSVCLDYVNGKFVRGMSRGDGCLDFDTVLETDKGFFKIGDIIENKIQCKIKAFDFELNKEIFDTIKNFFINENNDSWYELKFSNGKILKVTENHKLWVANKKCWKKVKDIDFTDEFLEDPF